MRKFYILFFTLFLFTTEINATNIAVIDINYLINNSKHFIEISEKITNSQLKYKEEFKNIEQNLFKNKSELQDSELILSEAEFNLKKNEYYEKVKKYEDDVLNFNNHYENEIINIKNLIFSKISELIQEYASSNQIDLIIEKNQYLLAAEKINISKIIFTKLNEINIELTFKEYAN